MNKLLQIKLAVGAAVGIFVIGTCGFMALEGWNLLDSAYMTAITLSTVGFLEVHEPTNMGRIFTMVLIFTGGGYYLYLVGVIIKSVIEGEIKELYGRQRLDRKIAKLKGHYIVCGYGRIGKVLCDLIREDDQEVVVIEQDDNLSDAMIKDKVHYLVGDATDERVLEKAGIHQADYLIAALATDTANVFLVLTARQLNKDIRIMARASKPGVRNKLMVAGADQVESPYDIGAVSMGLKLLRPSVKNFLDIALTRKMEAIQLEEVFVPSSSQYTHVMLKDSGIRQDFNLIVISIQKESGKMLFNPHFETLIEPGDTVIVMGESRDLKRFSQAVNPERKKKG